MQMKEQQITTKYHIADRFHTFIVLFNAKMMGAEYWF